MGYWCPECHNIFDDKFDKDKKQCKQCNYSNIILLPDNLNIKMGELFLLSDISKDINFLNSMIELKQNDVIEYELKMSQFRNQVEQQKNNQVQVTNVIKCPTCNSTKVKRISGTAKVAGAVAFGLFSKTARSQFKCENCGYKW